jgi:hypothetical protein
MDAGEVQEFESQRVFQRLGPAFIDLVNVAMPLEIKL